MVTIAKKVKLLIFGIFLLFPQCFHIYIYIYIFFNVLKSVYMEERVDRGSFMGQEAKYWSVNPDDWDSSLIRKIRFFRRDVPGQDTSESQSCTVEIL